ncbi:TetR family transcriptional regulator [Streptomyces sp. Je 1-332]
MTAEVLDEFGFSGADINKITKRSGVTPGALYFHLQRDPTLRAGVLPHQ